MVEQHGAPPWLEIEDRLPVDRPMLRALAAGARPGIGLLIFARIQVPLTGLDGDTLALDAGLFLGLVGVGLLVAAPWARRRLLEAALE